MFHLSFFGSVVEAAEFKDEFFLGGENVTQKIYIYTKKVVELLKFDFLNRCSDGRSETADAKSSSKHNRFDIHMLDSEIG
jgi:hypothetical protein